MFSGLVQVEPRSRNVKGRAYSTANQPAGVPRQVVPDFLESIHIFNIRFSTKFWLVKFIPIANWEILTRKEAH